MFVICKWAQTLALPEDEDISRALKDNFVVGFIGAAIIVLDYFCIVDETKEKNSMIFHKHLSCLVKIHKVETEIM